MGQLIPPKRRKLYRSQTANYTGQPSSVYGGPIDSPEEVQVIQVTNCDYHSRSGIFLGFTLLAITSVVLQIGISSLRDSPSCDILLVFFPKIPAGRLVAWGGLYSAVETRESPFWFTEGAVDLEWRIRWIYLSTVGE